MFKMREELRKADRGAKEGEEEKEGQRRSKKG